LAVSRPWAFSIRGSERGLVLAILCHLAIAPKSVSELETLLSSRQPVVSQHLARLRLEGLVTARRDGKAIYYSIRDPKVQELLGLLDWRSR